MFRRQQFATAAFILGTALVVAFYVAVLLWMRAHGIKFE